MITFFVSIDTLELVHKTFCCSCVFQFLFEKGSKGMRSAKGHANAVSDMNKSVKSLMLVIRVIL